MAKNLRTNLNEIIFASSLSSESQAIGRLVKSGKLKKIAPRIYTTNLTDNPSQIIRRNLFPILDHLFPKAVVSHRSALESLQDHIFLTYKHKRTVELPGVTIKLLQGKGALQSDTPLMTSLHISSPARAYLENLQPTKEKGGGVQKSLTREEIEAHLEKLCQIRGEVELNKLRDQARKIAKSLKLTREFSEFHKIIGALLKTQPSKVLEKNSKALKVFLSPRKVAYGSLPRRYRVPFQDFKGQ